MTNGMGDRERICRSDQKTADRACSINPHSAVGQPPDHIAQNISIPPHITDAGTHCTEPRYFCVVLRDRCACEGWKSGTDKKIIAVFFEGTLKVGLKPRDPYGGELPIV